MKIVYIAHPIAGDVAGNLAKIAAIIRDIANSQPHIIPFCPYFAYCSALDDGDPVQRGQGLKYNEQIIASGIAAELWLYGDKITPGMGLEIAQFLMMDKPVLSKSPGTSIKLNGLSV
jgi:hypothetical protein